MRFRGARDNTWSWILIVVAIIVIAAIAWFLFLAPR